MPLFRRQGQAGITGREKDEWPRKWQGELVGADMGCLRRLAVESRDYLATQAGFTVDPVEPPVRRPIEDSYLRDYFASRERQ